MITDTEHTGKNRMQNFLLILKQDFRPMGEIRSIAFIFMYRYFNTNLKFFIFIFICFLDFSSFHWCMIFCLFYNCHTISSSQLEKNPCAKPYHLLSPLLLMVRVFYLFQQHGKHVVQIERADSKESTVPLLQKRGPGLAWDSMTPREDPHILLH